MVNISIMAPRGLLIEFSCIYLCIYFRSHLSVDVHGVVWLTLYIFLIDHKAGSTA